MKSLFAIALLSLSFTSFAAKETYVGSDNGSACELRLNVSKKFAGVNDCGVLGTKKFQNTGKQIIVEGSVDFTDCRIIVDLNNEKVPTRAVLSTKVGLNPIYRKAVDCRDLKRVK